MIISCTVLPTGFLKSGGKAALGWFINLGGSEGITLIHLFQQKKCRLELLWGLQFYPDICVKPLLPKIERTTLGKTGLWTQTPLNFSF